MIRLCVCFSAVTTWSPRYFHVVFRAKSAAHKCIIIYVRRQLPYECTHGRTKCRIRGETHTWSVACSRTANSTRMRKWCIFCAYAILIILFTLHRWLSILCGVASAILPYYVAHFSSHSLFTCTFDGARGTWFIYDYSVRLFSEQNVCFIFGLWWFYARIAHQTLAIRTRIFWIVYTLSARTNEFICICLNSRHDNVNATVNLPHRAVYIRCTMYIAQVCSFFFGLRVEGLDIWNDKNMLSKLYFKAITKKKRLFWRTNYPLQLGHFRPFSWSKVIALNQVSNN